MPAIITTLLGVIGSTLLKMAVATVSADMIKFAIIQALEYALVKYEARAYATPESGDDAIADSLRQGLDKLKEAWEKV
jgi:hypothetical protein